tara:strand:+ start:215 stop:1189 length:975 start_codon:yes stop_codon:yes gene_type:complete
MTLNHSVPTLVSVKEDGHGKRLDVFISELFPTFSRSHLQQAIRQGHVLLDGTTSKMSAKVRDGQTISIILPEPRSDGPVPENIPLDILFEDEHLIAINKPPAMVVHPAKGNWTGTLASALAYHFEQLSDVGGPTRPGIVHRLDRDTSGVILVAKSNPSHLSLSNQFQQRTIKKTYVSIVQGSPERDRDTIRAAICQHPRQREKMSVTTDDTKGKYAESFYEVEHRWGDYSQIRVSPKTGRTHQIRVHMKYVGHPVACDCLYANHDRISTGDLGLPNDPVKIILDRQALHAHVIEFDHPITNIRQQIVAPIREDIATLAALLASR